jgi:uncharacterized protein YbdZ (MbtH family)
MYTNDYSQDEADMIQVQKEGTQASLWPVIYAGIEA